VAHSEPPLPPPSPTPARPRSTPVVRAPSAVAAAFGLPAEQSTEPTLVICSWDKGGLRQLSLRLFGRANVVVARDAGSLEREAARHPRAVILLDAAAAAVGAEEAVAALGELAKERPVVVWGAGRRTRQTLAALEHTRRWMYVREDVAPRELAELLASLWE